MSNLIAERHYIKAYQANLGLQSRVQEFCLPLKHDFNINVFSYFRFYDGGYHICLSNSLDFMQIYMPHDYNYRTEFSKTKLQFLKQQGYSRVLWPENTTDELILKSRNKDIDHGYNLHSCCENYVEAFFFATSQKHSTLRNLYDRYAVSLENFATCFVNNFNLEISSFKKNEMVFSPHMRKYHNKINSLHSHSELIDQNISSFNTQLTKLNLGDITSPSQNPQLEVYLDLNNLSNNNINLIPGRALLIEGLSQREKECLKHASYGYSAKEIALILSLSPRTVECYLQNIRYKTQSNSIMDALMKLGCVSSNYQTT